MRSPDGNAPPGAGVAVTTASEPDVPGVTSNEYLRTEAVQVKRMLAAAVTTFLLTGCSSPTSESADACSVDPAERSAEVVTQPEVAEVSESASNVGLHVTSTLEEGVRLTVRFGGTLALDIEMPGTASEMFTSTRLPVRLPTASGPSDSDGND